MSMATCIVINLAGGLSIVDHSLWLSSLHMVLSDFCGCGHALNLETFTSSTIRDFEWNDVMEEG